jgi:hypothetical protein
MSFVFATPENVAGAASDLANIGSTISSANAAALAPTSGVLAAGADEVSATIAALFGAHAQAYQALSAQAALFHEQFVQLMSGGSAQYALAEAANASPLQTVEQGVMSGIAAPTQTAAAAPATGNSATAVLATGTSGGSGGFGAGSNGAVGRLMGSVGGGPAAAAVGNSGASFGTGWAGFGGTLSAGQNLGGVGLTGGNGGLVASGGAVEAAESAEGLGIGGYGGTPVAAADPAVTPLAAVPAAAPVNTAAMARPATPAYSPAAAPAAESSEE